MKNLFLFMIAFSLSVFAGAQELGKNQHRGEIVFTNGNVLKGIIEADFDYPWSIQKGIKYYDEAVLSQEKIKGKDKIEYEPKDIVSMKIGDRNYKVKKYADMTAAGTGSIPRNYFLEVVAEGKINLYKYYQSPMIVGNTYEVEKSYNDCRTNPDIVISKGEDKLKAVQNVDIREYISDNPQVLDKYLNGMYGNPKTDPEKSKFASKIHSDASIQAMKEWIKPLVEDYNNN